MIDRERLMNFVDHDLEAVADMARAFLDSVPEDLAKARAAAATGDLKQLGFSLHKLKSSVTIFHKGPTAARLDDLEKQAHAGDASRVVASLVELEEGIAALVEEVRALLSKP